MCCQVKKTLKFGKLNFQVNNIFYIPVESETDCLILSTIP